MCLWGERITSPYFSYLKRNKESSISELIEASEKLRESSDSFKKQAEEHKIKVQEKAAKIQ